MADAVRVVRFRGLGMSGVTEPLCGAVPAERGDVGNDAQVEGLRLDRWRKLAGIHDQAVYLDEPDHGVRVDHVLAQELRRTIVHLHQVTDLLAFAPSVDLATPNAALRSSADAYGLVEESNRKLTCPSA